MAPLCNGNKCQVSQQQPGCSKVESRRYGQHYHTEMETWAMATFFTHILNATSSIGIFVGRQEGNRYNPGDEAKVANAGKNEKILVEH